MPRFPDGTIVKLPSFEMKQEPVRTDMATEIVLNSYKIGTSELNKPMPMLRYHNKRNQKQAPNLTGLEDKVTGSIKRKIRKRK